MATEKCCKVCGHKLSRKYNSTWDTLPDIKKANGTFLFWLCLFVPFIAPAVCLIFYYTMREEKSKGV